MPHVVTDKCNECKFTDCVEVCPVACFYEMDKQVVIHPEDCIDCMACVDVCPVHAIYEEADLPPEFTKDIEFNATQAHQLKDSGAGGDHSEKGSFARRERAKKSLGLLTPKAPAGHARPAAGYSLCAARALEVARVYARSFSHSDARDWGERRRLRSSQCGPAAPAGCERPAESLSASHRFVD